MSHYEQRLQADLSTIRGRVEQLSSDVESAFKNSVRALQTGNRNLAYSTVLRDARINRSMREIDVMCHRFIVRHLPSAGHLRLMSAILRTIIQYERIGDYAVTIAREAVHLSAPPSGAMAREVDLMSSHAIRMLEQAMTAFNEGNEELARATMNLGEHAEGTLDTLYAELTSVPDPSKVKDLVALFVVFNMVKRVLDQSKNVCEETIFAATGEAKAGRVHGVVFIDRENAALSPMAEAIARRAFPEDAVFSSAGRAAAADLDPGMREFMEQHGYDMSELEPQTLDTGHDSLSAQFVIVSLQDPITSYFDEIPFHTSVLEWDLGDTPTTSDGFEALYRELAHQIRDLVHTLTGKDDG